MASEKVHDILSQYRTDKVMLDAFWQWASNPTSKSAGLALEENYRYIMGNLMRRYALGDKQAIETVRKAKAECDKLWQSADIYSIYNEIHEELEGELGADLRSEVTRKVEQASPTARCAIALFYWLSKQNVPAYNLQSLFDEPAAVLQALLRAILGALSGSEVVPFQEMREELIQCGVLNRLYYRSTKGNVRDTWEFGLAVPALELTEVIPSRSYPDAGLYVSDLFERQMLEEARILEEVAYDIFQEYSELLPDGLCELIPSRGFLGVCEFHSPDYGKSIIVALNPRQRNAVLKALVGIKAQRIAATVQQVRGGLRALRDKEYPLAELLALKDDADRKVWRLDRVGMPRLLIYLGNWASKSDLRFLREEGADKSDSFVFILADQSLPSISKVLASSLKWWHNVSITVMITTAKGTVINQVQDKEHPLARQIVSILEEPPVTPEPVPVTNKKEDEQPEQIKTPKTSQKSSPRALTLGDIVSEEELRKLAQQSNLTPDERREKLTLSGTFVYPLATATTHTAIFGTVGSGKSETTKRLAQELVEHGVPVTIIDWHDEYVNLVRDLGGIVAVPPTSLTKPGSDEVPFTWNVLDPHFYSPNVTPEVIADYIQIVVDLFEPKDLMELTEPMKGGLTEALKLVYERGSVPTFKQVSNLVKEVAIPPATADALRRRLERFSGGSLGSIFCAETSFDPQQMFSKTMGVRVKHLTEDHRSAVGLLTFFLLRQAASHFKRLGEVDSQAPVRHVIIIDEGPMVIGSNPKVRHQLVHMLKEVRKFGEGLILVCRNTGIGDDILEETNQMIAHKLHVPKDVASVAKMLGLKPEDRALLRSLPPGVAFARIGSNPTALVRIKARKTL